jgi:hypothetical protein
MTKATITRRFDRLLQMMASQAEPVETPAKEGQHQKPRQY